MSDELDKLVQPEVVDPKAAEREKGRLRKRAQRAREKAEREAQKSQEAVAKERARLKSIKTVQEWWSQNRAAMTPEALEALLEQDDDILLLHDAIEALLLGVDTAEDLEDLAITIRLVRELFPRGLAPVALVNLDQFWTKDLPSQSAEADTFLRTGLLTILPDTLSLHRFIQQYAPDLYKQDTTEKVAVDVKWETAVCAKCKNPNTAKAVQAGMFDEKHPFICHQCLGTNVKAKQTVVDDGSTIFDTYGRIKT